MQEGPKKKILLIDDDTSLLVTLSDFLRFEGYDVTTAESGEQGLKKLAPVNPDLVVLDMSMPGMGGIGFMNEVCSADGKPSHPVLVLTARANMAEFFADVQVDGFVAKPCSPEDLLMEVSRILFLQSGHKPEDGQDGRAQKAVKVLIGEDDPMETESLRHAFTGAGFIFSSVDRGPDVIEQAIVQRPDLIVVKYILSKMNGDAVAEMLQEMPNTRDIPVLLYDSLGSLKGNEQVRGVSTVVLSRESSEILAAARQLLA